MISKGQSVLKNLKHKTIRSQSPFDLGTVLDRVQPDIRPDRKVRREPFCTQSPGCTFWPFAFEGYNVAEASCCTSPQLCSLESPSFLFNNKTYFLRTYLLVFYKLTNDTFCWKDLCKVQTSHQYSPLSGDWTFELTKFCSSQIQILDKYFVIIFFKT